MARLLCGINSFSVLFSTWNQTKPTENMATRAKQKEMMINGCFAILSPEKPKKRSKRLVYQLQNLDHQKHGLKLDEQQL